MADEQQEKDRIVEIEEKMNSMDVQKRKRFLYIFAIVCASLILLRLVVTLGGCTKTKKEEVKTESVSELSQSEKQRILEYSLETKPRDKKIEDFMDRLVEEDRKATENKEKDGKAK